MDEIAKYNRRRWEALVKAQAIFTRPYLDLDRATAQTLVDPDRRFGPIEGKQVLCLAGGGGQQSVAFALLGAAVTVVDLSEGQLQRDREAAAHYQLKLATKQGDMRDLSGLDQDKFDVVYQPYSLNFVPAVQPVFREVSRVLRPGGTYYFNCANPFLAGLQPEDWTGQGYPLHRPYLSGAEIVYRDESWVFRGDMPEESITPPKEYRHTLSDLVNGLIAQHFMIVKLLEENLGEPNPEAKPGTPDHFTAIAPPWLRFWAVYRPDVV